MRVDQEERQAPKHDHSKRAEHRQHGDIGLDVGNRDEREEAASPHYDHSHSPRTRVIEWLARSLAESPRAAEPSTATD